MLHPLLVLFNSILFFMVHVFAPNEEPSITTNFPSTMVVDHEAVLEIKISKGALSGFATFQMDLPEGFVPREIENAEAEFSTSEGQMVWSWNELPQAEELIISIGITPNSVSGGKKLLGASFYYIDNNEKKSKDIPQTEITVLLEGETENVLNTQATPSNATQATATEGSHAEPAGLVEVLKTISDGNNPDEKRIDLVIKKGITKGFARYSDNLEAGFSAKALKTDGSSFSIADGKIKFVWVSVPEKEELNVSYVLIRQSGTDEVSQVGEYSYLEHNQSKKVESTQQFVRFGSGATLGVKDGRITMVDPKKDQSEKPKESTTAPQNTTQNKLEAQAKQQKNPTNFAVQIGAFTNTKVTAQTLKRKFKLKHNIRSEFQEGYSKFMFGSYTDYKAARNQREQTVVAGGVKSAFVVAYNNGKRITVQEALMILNQKWFK